MGCAASGGGTEEERMRSREIDVAIKKEQKVFEKQIKILLLGAGESGKSTILKQMKFLYCQGYSNEEKEEQRDVIYASVTLAVRIFVKELHDGGHALDDSCTAAVKNLYNHFQAPASEMALLSQVKDSIMVLWKDPAIKQLFEDRHVALNIPPSMRHFFDQIERVAVQNYAPTQEDILLCRTRTTGIHELDFEAEGAFFKMVDVGGQRSERRKWIHCFQDVTGLIFFVALSEYNETLYEDSSVLRMVESLILFSDILSTQWFDKSVIMLFLNKCDLFKEKIAHTDLNVCFPEYDGGKNYAEAVRFIGKKFVSLNKKAERQISVYVTCATDTKMVEKVFATIREALRKHAYSSMFGEGTV